MSLFPVKVRELVESLRTSGALQSLASCAASVPVASADDGKTRILVCGGRLQQAAVEAFDLAGLKGWHRLRVAVPNGVTKLFVPQETLFEVYHGDGQLLHSTPLPELDEPLAFALESELLHAIADASKTKSKAAAT